MNTAARTAFDALIIGAGLAGSTTALMLARAGWSVALVERQPFPRHKVCGECMAASNLPLLQSLGVGDAFNERAGPPLRRVSLLHGGHAVTAGLPPAPGEGYTWGRALGRDSLDALLLDEARAAGAKVFQPWAVQTIGGKAGDWHCDLRSLESARLLPLRARAVIDAHGSWEDLPSDRRASRFARSGSDLFAFKASFAASRLPEGTIHVLALEGGYGGMVVSGGGTTTVACCVRRDRLSALRDAAPGLRAGDGVEAWLKRECTGVQRALLGAVREGPWLTCGPLKPGVHLSADDGIFRIGHAAGEAHPILGEGMSMALQSAAMLCSILVDPGGSGRVPAGHAQAALQRRYKAEWRRAFVPRMRLAAAFAHLAMRPVGARALIGLLDLWPGLLTRGAIWGGKVRAGDRPRPATEESIQGRPFAGSMSKGPTGSNQGKSI